MPTIRTPSYRRHKFSGQAVVTVSGRDIYLGRYGTKASRAEYDRIIAEWLQRGRALPVEQPAGPSINEVCEAYRGFATDYYRDTGHASKELGHIKTIIRPLRTLFGMTRAADFGPLRLKAVRQSFIDAGQCRRNVNANVQRVKRIFKWAVAQELVPATVWHALQAVEGLRAGHSSAPESDPVRPVPDAFVDIVCGRVLPEVAAIVRLQRLTGARSGELCIMRTCDIDTSGDVWCYRPMRHKTAHHGHTREIWIGPKAQDVLRPWLRTDLQAYIFSPKQARETQFAACRTHRHQPAKQPVTKRRLGDRYTPNSLRHAVQDAVAKINMGIRERNAETGGNEPEIPNWHPHQLRHNAATELRKQFGIEVARAVLGQTTLTATMIYAEMDRAAAQNAIGKIG